MRNTIIVSLNFLGSWLIYTFSTYQGLLELSTQKKVLKEYEKATSLYKEVSIIYWVFPPLKIHLELKRIKKIIKSLSVNTTDFDDIYTFSNKSIAWFYVAIGGLFASISATNDILDYYHLWVTEYVFWLIILVMLMMSVLYLKYRMSQGAKRNRFNKFIS